MLTGLISGTGPGTNPGRDAKLCQANSGTYAIRLISWAVNCHQAVWIWYIGVSWEGNRRSGVALAMRHRHRGLSTYGLNSQRQGDEHPRICRVGAWHYLPYLVPKYSSIFEYYDLLSPLTSHDVYLVHFQTRRLATANRSRVSIRGRPYKNCPQISLDHHAKFDCRFWCRVRSCKKSQNLADAAGAPHHYDGALITLEIRYSAICVIIPNFVALGQTAWV